MSAKTHDLPGSALAALVGAGVAFFSAQQADKNAKAIKTKDQLEHEKMQAWLFPSIYLAVGQGLKSGLGQDAAGNAFIAAGAGGLTVFFQRKAEMDREIENAPVRPYAIPVPGVPGFGTAGYPSEAYGAYAGAGVLLRSGQVQGYDPNTAELFRLYARKPGG